MNTKVELNQVWRTNSGKLALIVSVYSMAELTTTLEDSMFMIWDAEYKCFAVHKVMNRLKALTDLTPAHFMAIYAEKPCVATAP